MSKDPSQLNGDQGTAQGTSSQPTAPSSGSFDEPNVPQADREPDQIQPRRPPTAFHQFYMARQFVLLRGPQHDSSLNWQADGPHLLGLFNAITPIAGEAIKRRLPHAALVEVQQLVRKLHEICTLEQAYLERSLSSDCNGDDSDRDGEEWLRRYEEEQRRSRELRERKLTAVARLREALDVAEREMLAVHAAIGGAWRDSAGDEETHPKATHIDLSPGPPAHLSGEIAAEVIGVGPCTLSRWRSRTPAWASGDEKLFLHLMERDEDHRYFRDRAFRLAGWFKAATQSGGQQAVSCP